MSTAIGRVGRMLIGLTAALALTLAGTTPAVASQAADDGSYPSSVTIHKAEGVPGVKIGEALAYVWGYDRGDFTQQAVKTVAKVDGKPYNVIIMNLAAGYKNQLTGVKLYANITWDGVFYGLWIATGGTFTNEGDGGYINWAFRGQFTRSGPGGKVVHFH